MVIDSRDDPHVCFYFLSQTDILAKCTETNNYMSIIDIII